MNDKVSVTVQPGDIVIDAGSWIGDFAAYASVKGAQVYAFEPTDTTFETLKKTAELNGNIIPVKKGLSDKKSLTHFFVSTVGNSGANRIDASSGNFTEASSEIETTRLDDFVRDNNLPRVDFIKADIEGFERHMLAGAQETLARFAPKLALCTYHLPDDPEVMARLILPKVQHRPETHETVCLSARITLTPPHTKWGGILLCRAVTFRELL